MPRPYGSFGNGAAMRVSPVAFLYRGRSREEALALSDRVTEITHDHPEGIRGARSVTEAIWLALQAEGAETVRREIANRYGYDLKRSVEDKHDIQTKVMTTLFALFAEVERDLISERTRGASPGPGPRARSWGVQKGRSACHASTARRTTSATSSTSASRKARSPRSPASPDRLSTTSSAREASSRIASVYFYTNLVSTLMTGSPRPGTQAKTKRPVFRFGNHFRTTRAHRGRLVVRSSE